ncbi:MAG: ATP-dependent helicase, partial [Myxococcales bacterium]|nr:ATP-dependent helicase [Myxococcales bacterium]
NVPETYVHRIGRTARAGASGIALSFCDDEERAYLVDIERLIRKHIERIEDHAYPPSAPPPSLTVLNGKAGPAAAARPANSGKGNGAGAGASKKSGRGRPRRGKGRPVQASR